MLLDLFQCWLVVDGIFGIVVDNDVHFLGWWWVVAGIFGYTGGGWWHGL